MLLIDVGCRSGDYARLWGDVWIPHGDIAMTKPTKITLYEDILEGKHRKLSTRELRDNLAHALSFTSKDKGKLILTKNGEDRAGLVSIEDVWLLDALDDLKIKEALKYGLSKQMLWSTLRERLSLMVLEDGEAGERGDNERSHRTTGT